MNIADMTHEEASLLARKYARMDAEVKALQKEMDRDKGVLRQWMGLFEQDELLDAETGLGVKFGKPRRQTEWDTLSMPLSLIEQLKTQNYLTVRTTQIDKAKGTSSAVDEAQRYRIDGESEPPFQVVKGDSA